VNEMTASETSAGTVQEGATRSEELKRAFILGCRRSGTTWGLLLLARHPAIVGLQQIDLFRSIVGFGKWWRHSERFGMTVISAERDGDRILEGFDRRPVSDSIDQEAYYQVLRNIAVEVFDRFAASVPGTRVVVDQEPENVRAWEEIHHTLPDAYFLHIIRDPRSVYCSQRDAHHNWASRVGTFHGDPHAIAMEWCADVSRARGIREVSNRYLEVHYEDLIKDGPRELARMLEWLGLPPDDEYCRNAIEACSLDKLRTGKHAPKGFFRKGQAEGWRSEMSRSELRIVEYIAGDLMEQCGYERTIPAGGKAPFRVSVLQARKRMTSRLSAWIWEGDGAFRTALIRVLRRVPFLHRLARTSIRESK